MLDAIFDCRRASGKRRHPGCACSRRSPAKPPSGRRALGIFSGFPLPGLASPTSRVGPGWLSAASSVVPTSHGVFAAISLPVLAGRLYDLTGGYETAVIVAGGANLLAVLVALTLPRQKLPTPAPPGC